MMPVVPNSVESLAVHITDYNIIFIMYIQIYMYVVLLFSQPNYNKLIQV